MKIALKKEFGQLVPYSQADKEALDGLADGAVYEVDITAAKNAIKDGVAVDGAEIEILHDSDTLKVNKRRTSQSKTSAS